jgi:DNA recombination protein RmuC
MDTPITLATAVILIAVAGIVGLLLGWLLLARPARARAAESEQRFRDEQARAQALAVEKATAAANGDRVPGLEATIESLRTQLGVAERSAEAHAVRVQELGRMGEEIERKFAVLAADVLGKNSASLLQQISERFDRHKVTADEDLEKRQKAVEVLVKPITDSLGKFEAKVAELEKAREGAYQGITEQVRSLAEGQSFLRSETTRLVQALRQPKTRGRWGEYQLRNVLEMAGMTEHVDFDLEHTIQGESGALRPDVIVRLPGGKTIVVDAKTPLEGYLSAVEAKDEAARDAFLSDHARHVASHVRSLSSKEYWSRLQGTPDFVVMFVPGEAFFSAAIENDPSLFEQALRQRVLISTPTTFIALVKAIAYGWQQEKLTESAQAVAGVARDLYDRVKVFGEHMAGVGNSLRKAVEKYNSAVGSLEGRVLPAARRFEALGVTPAGMSIKEVRPIELEPREVQAAELVAPGDGE